MKHEDAIIKTLFNFQRDNYIMNSLRGTKQFLTLLVKKRNWFESNYNIVILLFFFDHINKF